MEIAEQQHEHEHEHEHEHDDDAEHDGDGALIPESVRAAQRGEVKEPGEVEMDATAWLLDSEGPTPDEVEPVTIRLNVGTQAPKYVEWQVVPLPDAEFRKLRKLAMGNRRTRRALAQGDVTELNEWEYHLGVVAAATVSPDLRTAAAQKGVADVRDVLRHRFAHKPGLINQISGIVSDVSGMDEADAEVVAKNS